MSALLAGLFGKLVASKIGLAGASALGGVLLVKIAPLVRPLFGKLFKSQLDRILAPDLADPKEKELLRQLALSAMAYAEHKIPDRGQGVAKKALVIAALSKFVPGVAAQVVGDLIEEAFGSLDDEMKKRLDIKP
jgi:hypothetical protein